VIEDLDWAPEGIELDRPNAARVYDYYLGGGHHFEADRRFAAQVIEKAPEVISVVRHNRGFLRRSVRFLAESGVRQFLDLGSGIPTVGNVHEVVQRIDPECRVVYVDREEIAVAHARLLLRDVPNATVTQHDIRDAAAVLDDPATRGLLDFSQPIAVLMYAVLHCFSNSDSPVRIVAEYRDATSPGSYLAISHPTIDHDPVRLGEATEVYEKNATPVVLRTRQQVNDFFAGYEILDPGIVHTPEWRPENPADVPNPPSLAACYAAVGRRL
jgi:SAM-dependent methyltransferase